MKRLLTFIFILTGAPSGAHWTNSPHEDPSITKWYFFDQKRFGISNAEKVTTIEGESDFPWVIQLLRPWMRQYAESSSRGVSIQQDRGFPMVGRVDNSLVKSKLQDLIVITLWETGSSRVRQTGRFKIQIAYSNIYPNATYITQNRPADSVAIWNTADGDRGKCHLHNPSRATWQSAQGNGLNVLALFPSHITMVAEWMLDHWGKSYDLPGFDDESPACDLINAGRDRAQRNEGCIPSDWHPSCNQQDTA